MLEAAVATLREVPAFGQNLPPNFKWPTFIDLLKMPTHAPIKVQELKWAKHTNYKDLFGGIQVVLSNGLKSHLITKNEKNDENWISVPIRANIKKIRGTSNSDWIQQINFLCKDDQELSNMTSSNNNNFATDQPLKEGE